MDLKKKFGTDPAAEIDGVDIHLGEDAYITVARAGGSNLAYQRAMVRISKANKRALQFDTLDPADADALMMEVLASTVVLGWRGVELDGKPLEFSKDNALRLFKEVPEVYRIVQDESQRLANFRAEDVRESGNVLGSASSG